jgi:FkbM family methyltransferase
MWSVLKSGLKRTAAYRFYSVRKTAARIASSADGDERAKAFFQSFLAPGDLVFDVGAHIGNYTRILLAAGCKVVSVEPQPDCVAILRRAFNDRIIVIEAAASDSQGTATLHVSPAGMISSMSPDWMRRTQASGRFADRPWDAGRPITVNTVPLDALVAAYGRPAFIKIDVEGHELAVLRGLSNDGQTIAFEFTPEAHDVGMACLARTEELGCREYNFSFEDGFKFHFSHWLSRKELEVFLKEWPAHPHSFGDIYARPARVL